MKEIIALDEAIRALALDALAEDGIDFSRDELGGEVEQLPETLQAEITALQQAINATLPEDFDYFVFVALPDEPASFSLNFEQMPAGGSDDGTFQPERSLIEQLQAVDWEEQRTKAIKREETWDGFFQLRERATGPLRSAKALQREFREEAREFIKEKRVDAARLHVLYWDEEEGMIEAAFDDAAALREALPNLIARGSEIVTIIAWGKPLPVERIDALKSEAQKTLRERLDASLESAEQEEAAERALSAGLMEAPPQE